MMATLEPAPTPALAQDRFAISLGLLVLRLALGWVFIFHGGQKALGLFDGSGFSAFASGIEKMNLPLLPGIVWAALAAYGEFLGGICVALGLLTRLATLPLLTVMLVAIATVHGKNGFSLQNHGYEYNMVLTALAGAILIIGPGLLSLDALLFRRPLWSRGPHSI